MNAKRIVALTIAPLFLVGCKRDEAFVDLSGIVFIVFVTITVGKYLSPALFQFSIFKRLRERVSRFSKVTMLALIMVAIALNVYWVISDSILDRILGLVGLSLVVWGYHLEFIDSDDAAIRSRAIEIVTMGIVISSLLTVMWAIGPEMLKP